MEIPAGRPPRPMFALLYHELRTRPAAYSYVVPSDAFASHLQLFAELSAPDAASFLPVVTFDDGHLSNYEQAHPLLERFVQTAHFFITVGWTGRRVGYMNAEQVRALHRSGQQIGAHGWSHMLLTACSPAELRHEVVDSKAALEDLLSAPVSSISLPGGRSNPAVLRACLEAGYSTIWTSVPEAAGLPLQGAIGRYNVLSSTTVAFLRSLLDPHQGVLAGVQRRHRIKALVQRCLGDRMYARVWAAVNREEALEAEDVAAAKASGHAP